MKYTVLWAKESDGTKIALDAGPHTPGLASNRADSAQDCQEYQGQHYRIFNGRSRFFITEKIA